MTESTLDRFTNAVRESAILAKLEAMARELTGGTFFILWCKDDDVHRLCPDGREADLPKFCRLTRATPEGAKRCSVCRSLVAVRACYQGLTDYCCHGGISVIAAPASIPDQGGSGLLVVSSCAFADVERERGWALARKHAEGLPVNPQHLRKAYYELPVLCEDKGPLVRSIVDVAACVLSEIHAGVTSDFERAQLPRPREDSDDSEVENLLGPALAAVRDGSVGKPGRGSASTLAEIVMSVVGNNPAIPFTVVNIARAARMTPNHFSTSFHKSAGKSFNEFLTEERIALARKLLSDPTLPVAEVALRAGFDDPSYFSRRFKQVTGETPKAYRACHC